MVDVIAWKSMDERERAVWSATLAAALCQCQFEEAVDKADVAVEALRAYLRSWPGGDKT